jgi:hypothetical protein
MAHAGGCLGAAATNQLRVSPSSSPASTAPLANPRILVRADVSLGFSSAGFTPLSGERVHAPAERAARMPPIPRSARPASVSALPPGDASTGGPLPAARLAFGISARSPACSKRHRNGQHTGGTRQGAERHGRRPAHPLTPQKPCRDASPSPRAPPSVPPWPCNPRSPPLETTTTVWLAQSLVTASMARGAGCSSRLALVEAIAVMTLAAPALQAPGLLSRPALPPALLPASSAGVTRRTLRLRGGATGLHDAVLAGSVFAIEGLIGAGADVDAPNDAGLSALHLAVEARRLGVAALLVAKGADVDACDAGERTPLHHAAARGHSGAVLVLLDLGADLAAADERGWTPLHEAVAAHQVITQTVRCLLCGTQRA